MIVIRQLFPSTVDMQGVKMLFSNVYEAYLDNKLLRAELSGGVIGYLVRG